ncbi:MAG: rRNA pseudouridine synthase [Butyricicoccus pullicaecorum]|nr:rRNA pseudouridine synthase [Butyricicoccus pullicaecorum]
MRMAKERLDKALSSLGCGSRKEVGAMIRAGRAAVNGEIIRDPAYKVTPAEDQLTLGGTPVRWRIGRYYMLNKPPDLVSACVDNLHETVLSVFPEAERRGLFPVGRLDKNTEGLLLITDDGGFAHALTAPRRHVDKVYAALVEGRLELSAPKRFAEGLTLADGTLCKPAELKIEGVQDGLTRVEVTLREGKHHQVKRMIAAVGGHVEHLKRLSIGPLRLDDSLAPGEYRELTEEEVSMLRNAARGNASEETV